jgi:hypothetical protein
MRYWRDREVSDRLQSARAYRKREPEQLSPAIGFNFDEPQEIGSYDRT